MHKMGRDGGWILMETVLLGLLVLAVAASLGIFARTALLREHAAARMEAVFMARAQFSRMEAELDHGIPPRVAVEMIASGERSYEMRTTVTRMGAFYDVQMRLSWNILGCTEEVHFVRRLRCHDTP